MSAMKTHGCDDKLIKSVAFLCIAGLLVCCSETPTRESRLSPQTTSACGNGVLDKDEACDGELLRLKSCTALGYAAGALACTAACTYDVDLCVVPDGCGDGVLSPDEECDGNLGQHVRKRSGPPAV
jgi:hypothetical protein